MYVRSALMYTFLYFMPTVLYPCYPKGEDVFAPRAARARSCEMQDLVHRRSEMLRHSQFDCSLYRSILLFRNCFRQGCGVGGKIFDSDFPNFRLQLSKISDSRLQLLKIKGMKFGC